MYRKRLINVLIILNFCSSPSGAQSIFWSKLFGGTSWDYGISVIALEDTNYIITGLVRSQNGDISGNLGSDDYWIAKLDYNGNILWSNCLGGSGADFHNSAIKYNSGILLTGMTSSNDGDVSGNHGDYDAWLTLVDSSGSILWQHCYGGTSWDWGTHTQPTVDGGLIFAGYTTSNDGDVSGNHGLNDFWILKLDSTGMIQWQSCFGGNLEDEAQCIDQTADGGFVAVGRTKSTNGQVTGLHGDLDLWVVKMDAGGVLQWQKCLGGTAEEAGLWVRQTNDGGYIISGVSTSNDGNVSCLSPLPYKIWIVKLDNLGNIQWDNCLNSIGTGSASKIEQMNDGSYLVSGTAYPGLYGNGDMFLAKLDSLGNLVWNKFVGGHGGDQGNGFDLTMDGGIITIGYSLSNDNDCFGNHSSTTYDILVAKINDDINIVSGDLFVDLNSNQSMDTNEVYLMNHQLFENSTGQYAFSQSAGRYYFNIPDSGQFNVYPDILNYYSTIPILQSIYFPGHNQVDSLNNFAFQPTGVYNDLCLSITPLGNFRSGMTASYMINYINRGTTSLNPTIIFYPDQLLTFDNAVPTPGTVTNDSITWNFGLLEPFHTGTILITLNVDSMLAIGTLINSGALILPVAGDANPVCNQSYHEVITTGSFDPNDIMVDKNIIYDFEIINPPFLEYTIRFQNVGNDTAFYVRVNNHLSPKLNLGTFELISTSHPMNISYENHSRLLKFEFPLIQLPDSGTNEPMSNGFVKYRIKPFDNLLMVGDVIKNWADIYFDSNSPVRTDTARTNVILLTGISIASPQERQSKIFPNPVSSELNIQFLNGITRISSVEVINIFGQTIKSLKFETLADRNEYIKYDLSGLKNGIYFILINGDSQERHKVIKVD